MSDIYSIGAIMKLLLENTETSNHAYTKLIENCLQTDPKKRIQFDVLILDPYFTSIYPPYKLVHGNLLFNNIRLFLHLYLHQKGNHNFKLRALFLFRVYCKIDAQTEL